MAAAAVRQLDLFDLHRCDVCGGSGVETDPETCTGRRCRACDGTGLLDYQPGVSANPFDGMETQ